MRKVIAGLTLAPLLLAGPAQADTILSEIVKDAVNGCYGVAVTVCHPRLSSNPVGVGSTTVPVCAGSCQNVNVPTPEGDGDPLCVAWEDSSGNASEDCIYFGPY